MLSDPNPAYSALGREGATSDPQVITDLAPHDPHLAGQLAALLLKELEVHHAGDEHSERLVDAIGVWIDRQEQN